MKKLLLITLLLPLFIHAQENCPGSFKGTIFQANDVGALYVPQGSKYFDQTEGYFKVPYASEKSPSTIFAASPWIGGYVNGDLRVAAQAYLFPDQLEYYIGPLDPNGNHYSTCLEFDRVWTVSRNDIENHKLDYSLDGVVDEPLPSVFGWPAQGNISFAEWNGFDLPANHHGGWADFKDLNQNSLYEPQLGEYPVIQLDGQPYEPDQIMWMVFNDAGHHFITEGDPLNVEIQLTVYGLSCTDNPLLNTTIFNSYKIINQNVAPIDSLHFGMWTDYDLGCSYDDFVGSDSTRSTEYVYNNDQLDGAFGIECEKGVPTYGYHPPVQSMTYLSHPMHTMVRKSSDDETDQHHFNLLAGFWGDGTPITSYETGNNPGSNYSPTKFLFHGDPRDTSTWVQQNFLGPEADPRTVSSVYLNSLASYESVIVDMAYMFHQDTSMDHLEKIGLMRDNIDSLFSIRNHLDQPCSRNTICESKDCVWPGDFNHNGIADHYDYLYWGVMKDNTGPKRSGQINWSGHYSDQWSQALPDGLNVKHVDGNGNGIINEEDLDRNRIHFLFTNPYYVLDDKFPEGPEIIMSSALMSTNGTIRDIQIHTGIDLENVLGLAFELDFDTSIYYLHDQIRVTECPVDSLIECFAFDSEHADYYSNYRYGFVKTDHQPLSIEEGTLFARLFGGLRLKDGVPVSAIPDSVIIRIKNLIAIDAEGNDLHFGARQLVVQNQIVSGTRDLDNHALMIYPNPTGDHLYVGIEQAAQGTLVNLQGQIIKSLLVSPTKPVDVSSLAAGVYYLRIERTGQVARFVKD